MNRSITRGQAVVPARLFQTDVAVTAVGALVLVLLLVFVVWPVLHVLLMSVTGPAGLTLAHFGEFFGTWRSLRILLNSLAVAAVSTVLTVLAALLLAVAVTRTTEGVRRLVSLTMRLPLVSPPFLIPLGLVLLIGREGVVTHGLRLEWSIEGFLGVVAAQALTFLAPATRLLTDALTSIDASLEEAATSLGAGELTTLSHVTFALTRPAISAAALGVFLLALGDFATPFVLGGGFEVLTTTVYARAVEGGEPGSAAALAVILLVPCLIAWAIGGPRSLGGKPGGAPVSVSRSAITRHVGLAVGGGTALVFGAIYAAVVARTFVHDGSDGWSLAWPAEIALPGALLVGSLATATAAGAGGTLLALAAGYTVERGALRRTGARAMTALSLLTAGVPGTVLGLGYLLAFLYSGKSGVWVLAASIVAGALPMAFLVARAGIARIEPAMEEAARSLGASQATTLRRIVLPLLRGPALAIFAWFFVQGLVSVSAVIFLVDSEHPLASVTGLVAAHEGHFGRASALATMVVTVAVGVMLVTRRLAGAPASGALDPVTPSDALTRRRRT